MLADTLVPELGPRSEPEPEPEPELATLWQPPNVASAPAPSETIATPLVVPVSVVRPKAQVRALPADPPEDGMPARLVSPLEAIAAQSLQEESLDLVAPVEMWFGDYRVGVKAGSKTHKQFRKYADVLLGDLKDTGERTR